MSHTTNNPSAATEALTISVSAWADLSERLPRLLPKDTDLVLKHERHGAICLGCHSDWSSLRPLCCYDGISITSVAEENPLLSVMVCSIIEAVLEGENLSKELVSTYSNLALLDTLGKQLPRCRTNLEVARCLGSAIHKSIPAMGCVIARDSNGHWDRIHCWGDAPSEIDIDWDEMMESWAGRKQCLLEDSGPLPEPLNQEDIGPSCMTPLTSTEGLEGLLILARETEPVFTSVDAQLLGLAAGQGAVRLEKIRQDSALRIADRMHLEMSIAGNIQRNLLPKSIPQLGAIHIDGALHGASKIGGDYYDVIDIGEHVVMVIADVSGHNVSAALAMNMVRTALRTSVRIHTSPAAVLTSLNNQISADLIRSQLFVSVGLIILRPDTGRFRISNAGHPGALQRTAHGDVIEWDTDGPVLGLFEKTTFPERFGCLEKGDSLLLYTDGVTECRNEKQDMFGLERLTETLHHPHKNATQLIEEVTRRIGSWSPGEREDDTTILAAKHLPE